MCDYFVLTWTTLTTLWRNELLHRDYGQELTVSVNLFLASTKVILWLRSNLGREIVHKCILLVFIPVNRVPFAQLHCFFFARSNPAATFDRSLSRRLCVGSWTTLYHCSYKDKSLEVWVIFLWWHEIGSAAQKIWRVLCSLTNQAELGDKINANFAWELPKLWIQMNNLKEHFKLRYIWLNGDFLNEFDYLPAENTN